MKNVKVTINYKVPSWNFCNYDTGFGVSNISCRFCEKTKGSFCCQLYDKPLKYDGTFVEKTPQCIKNTCNFGIEITEESVPTIKPREIMKQTLKLYDKYIKELMNQGFPRQMAEDAAKRLVMEDN